MSAAAELPLEPAPPTSCAWCPAPALGAVEGLASCALHRARALARAAHRRVQAHRAIDEGGPTR